jgi:hypothetical protein
MHYVYMQQPPKETSVRRARGSFYVPQRAVCLALDRVGISHGETEEKARQPETKLGAIAHTSHIARLRDAKRSRTKNPKSTHRAQSREGGGRGVQPDGSWPACTGVKASPESGGFGWRALTSVALCKNLVHGLIIIHLQRETEEKACQSETKLGAIARTRHKPRLRNAK